MFDSLTDRLTSVFSRLKGKGRLSVDDVKSGLREIRLALLEADVNYKVVKDLMARVQERAVGEDVLESLTPGQQVVKIVRDELTVLMGGQSAGLNLSHHPAVVMLVGLQGSGKTTTVAKLALHLQKEGRKPILVAADVYRPAAIAQLQTLGDNLEIPVVTGDSVHPVQIASAGVEWAKENLRDVVLIDTAGRLHIDEAMMNELKEIKSAVDPDEILFVADAMTGQEAVNIARTFNDSIAFSGVILTKLDGDARGGAALSVHHVTDKPIKFVGMGEKIVDLQPFHPDRMAERILGMGDVLSLIEQAETQMDQKKAEQFAHHIKKNQFTLQDFLEQLEEMRKLGPLAGILEKLPLKKIKGNVDIDERDLTKTLAVLRSMTLEERLNSSIIGGSRKKRIAQGSGTRVRDVNRVLSRFKESKKAIKLLSSKRGGKGRSPIDLMGM
ncbi:MAG: signal recognition particle protein [Candidatus Bipolaricaulota bacterium]|nr:signal recognition particle protein [Candidatus Bipolaricaulota bacterium]